MKGRLCEDGIIEVQVEVMTDMNVIEIVGEMEILDVEAGAVVLVMSVLKVGEEIIMIMISEVAVDQGRYLNALELIHQTYDR
ncbi:hypothetical protein V6N13_102654 [Hibiscus sabdariffa]